MYLLHEEVGRSSPGSITIWIGECSPRTRVPGENRGMWMKEDSVLYIRKIPPLYTFRLGAIPDT